MQTLIPIRPAALTHALDLSRRLGLRAQLEASSRISPDLWTVTVDAALARRHYTVVASLLQAELLPAVVEAMASLGEAMTLASTQPHDRTAPWPVEALPRLDRVVHRIGRACRVLTVAERRLHQCAGGPPPLSRDSGGIGRVLGMVLADLEAVLVGEDGWPSVAERLGDALCGMVGPVKTMVERLDAGDLDGVPLRPLKQALYEAHEAVAEALLFALGCLDPAAPHGAALARQQLQAEAS